MSASIRFAEVVTCICPEQQNALLTVYSKGYFIGTAAPLYREKEAKTEKTRRKSSRLLLRRVFSVFASFSR
jgi:hypothetical protein